MRILVIGGLRTKSSVLQESLAIKYGYQNLFECLNQHYNPEITTHKPWIETVKLTIDNLFTRDNFVTKIISEQCKFLTAELLNNLRLGEFDEIHLTERHDFFDSCASLQISSSTGKWFRTSEEPNLFTPMKLTETVILKKLQDISNYLEIKKYLLTKKINFSVHDYDKLVFDKDQVGKFYKNNLDYNQIIINSNIKTTLNEMFSKHYDYNSCQYNYRNLRKELFFKINLPL